MLKCFDDQNLSMFRRNLNHKFRSDTFEFWLMCNDERTRGQFFLGGGHKVEIAKNEY